MPQCTLGGQMTTFCVLTFNLRLNQDLLLFTAAPGQLSYELWRILLYASHLAVGTLRLQAHTTASGCFTCVLGIQTQIVVLVKNLPTEPSLEASINLLSFRGSSQSSQADLELIAF